MSAEQTAASTIPDGLPREQIAHVNAPSVGANPHTLIPGPTRELTDAALAQINTDNVVGTVAEPRIIYDGLDSGTTLLPANIHLKPSPYEVSQLQPRESLVRRAGNIAVRLQQRFDAWQADRRANPQTTWTTADPMHDYGLHRAYSTEAYDDHANSTAKQAEVVGTRRRRRS